MKVSILWHAAFVCVCMLQGCSATNPVRVLKEGQTRLTASVGGPIVPETSPIGFVPYVTAGLANGLTDDVTIHGNLHLLMAAYAVAGVDVGASYRVVTANNALPEITAGAKAMVFTDFFSLQSTRLYPEVFANASWEVCTETLVYAGLHCTMQPSPWQTLLSPMVGTVFPISNDLRLQVECIWQASNISPAYGIFEGQSSPGNHGVIGGFVACEVAL